MAHALKDFLQPGDLVFDVGANIGKSTQHYLDLGARVVAFEANPRLAATLCRRFAATPQAFIENKAVADRPGIVTLNICTQSPVLSTCNPQWFTGRFKQYLWDEKVQVPSVTLDMAMDFFGTPRFMKIDVEGFERQVLSGLSRPIGLLSFEFTIEFIENMGRCLEHLESIGMTKFNLGLAEHDALALPEWLSGEEVKTLAGDLGRRDGGLWGDVYAMRG
ncbi:methyltransferase FkbM family [Solidesulfovibrio carbinoliphilus subsp. oakridgensis]|uniref:Methyltransferase FkbM family n=1 Tax=Solidesulfovibrio carbinoliphilus subsp. oakridgensis TaxID=694327 RepID=G7Q7N7_9BACT|nr:FkbM family methyltransferase [Solidesulfovibrio carbinoliphilus]EHJ47346.1 methyltransferase FkbM family [Solidesulfovibrio carbinoliphilus subsp. oakridgensis]